MKAFRENEGSPPHRLVGGVLVREKSNRCIFYICFMHVINDPDSRQGRDYFGKMMARNIAGDVVFEPLYGQVVMKRL